MMLQRGRLNRVSVPNDFSPLSIKCENFIVTTVVAATFRFTILPFSLFVASSSLHVEIPYPGYGGAWLTEIPASLRIGIREKDAAVRRGKTNERGERAPYASHVCGFINWVRRWGFFY